MTESSPVEITGVWFPECGKKLVWNYGMLRSVISAGYPDGHRLLDCFVRAAKPHFYPELVDDVLEGQSLFFENIGMYIEEGSDKMILVDTTTQETAQIGKDTFLKLIADLGKDFCMTSFALSMKSQVDALHDMTAKVEKFLKKDNLLKVGTF